MAEPEIVKQNQQTLNVAIAKSATEKKWKNKSMGWEQLLDRFSNTVYTHETEDEYQNMKKADRDRIKDVGGFVGGYLKNGSRKAENVQSRQLITLDVDYPNGDVWEKVKKALKCEVVMYSTHSHRADNERYRIVIPLNRPCLPDEYQAVARKVADIIDIDIFDDTTYQPNRLMYWPSSPKDGEFIFRHQTGDFLDADNILDRYVDWKDTSEWPQSVRETKHFDRMLKKQEDPLSKKGLIGKFCRAYTIQEVIDAYLSDVYEATTHEDRYTYLEGSTYGGAVVYEDKFLYSHHGTDPASLQLCNAFDLVRIHKFGHLDGENTDVSVSKLPSFKEMQSFASQDEKVKLEIAREADERDKEIMAMFDDEEEDNRNWRTELEINDKGGFTASSKNIWTILTNDPVLKGKMAFDEFSNRCVVISPLPWNKEVDRDWSDSDDAGLRQYFENKYGIVSRPKIVDAVSILFEKKRFNPVADYLNSLKWDGVERLDTLLIDYLGAEDDLYARTITRKTLVAAVARVLEPGCKFDNMLILSGTQGLGKSSFFRLLGGKYYSDTIITVQGKEAYEQLSGVWIAEMGELTATKKADIESIKLFISKQEDHFRAAYERRAKTVKRKCILVGTTNDKEFLRDRTGNRRFWPINVGVNKPEKSIFTDFESEVDMIWAEAVERYKAGEKLYLDGEVEKLARQQQARFTEESSKAGMIRAYLDRELPTDWYKKSIYDRRSFINSDEFLGETGLDDYIKRNEVCTQEVWCELFSGDLKRLTPVETREIKDIIRNTPGWVEMPSPRSFGKQYGRQRWFKRVEEVE